MSEERAAYHLNGLLKPEGNRDTVKQADGFVEVRASNGKLIFRLDPVRLLVEWQDRREVEVIDLTPYLR